ncbi:MAG: Mth938-like domain-containing protein [Gammaproteobacteria bacterium]
MNKPTHSTLHPTELTRDTNRATYQFTAYKEGCATVNNEEHTNSFIIAPEKGTMCWEPKDLKTLDTHHWLPLLALKPQILLLGVGDTLRFPATKIIAPLVEQAIGLEIMTNDAVCRTYNVLVSEGRNVVAALLLG